MARSSKKKKKKKKSAKKTSARRSARKVSKKKKKSTKKRAAKKTKKKKSASKKRSKSKRGKVAKKKAPKRGPKKKKPAKKKLAKKKKVVKKKKLTKQAKQAKKKKVSAKGTGSPSATTSRKSRRIRICKQTDCPSQATTAGFCRLHYIMNWNEIKEAEQEKQEKKLNRYVERMMARHGRGRKAAKAIRKDIAAGGVDGQDAFLEDEVEEYVDAVSKKENLDRILTGLKVED